MMNIDLEFKRYLKLLRPYVAQLIDENIIKLCDAWIKRLSNCAEGEKSIRNKYVFVLCYQLARGMIDIPFTDYPPAKLQYLPDDANSDASDELSKSDDLNTLILFNNKENQITDTDYCSQEADTSSSENSNSNRVNIEIGKNITSPRKSVLFYTQNKEYEFRAYNLLKKLREIKTQNKTLHQELMKLTQDSKSKQHANCVLKFDHACQFVCNKESTVTLTSLKQQLQEIQDSRKTLIQNISTLQEQLDNFNDLKNNQILDIEAKHKLELIKVRTDTRDECRVTHDKLIEELTKSYQNKIIDIQTEKEIELKKISEEKDEIISRKTKHLELKEKEIKRLNNQADNQISSVQSVLNKFIQNASGDISVEDLKSQNLLLQKQLSQMEKSKVKCIKIYEKKLTYLEHERHILEYSLQLQLVRQRTQIVNELADENQVELNTALNKLENKYKEIVANVQATAIQTRLQDSKALETMIQTVCGFDNPSQTQNTSPVYNQNVKNDAENSAFIQCSRNGNALLTSNSYADDSLLCLPTYCLNRDKMSELLEKVHIPQRDSNINR